MPAMRITANLPAILEQPVKRQVKSTIYSTDSDYGVGLFLWDIYSRQDHGLTGPMLKLPRWHVDKFATDLASSLGEPIPRTPLKPFRFTVSIPEVLAPFVALRVHEVPYRSASAYISGLVFYDLKTAAEGSPKKVPHHKTSPLLREPQWIRAAVFKQLAEDFGNPQRTWPKGFDGRINELILTQRELPLR